MNRPQVIHIQRKQRSGGNFSLEFIFSDVRSRLKSSFDFVHLSVRKESNGVVNRIMNIIQVYFNQGDINHITGDIHYVSYLLKKKKTILTILDCGFMIQSNRIKKTILKWLWLDIPVWKSRFITTISEASKKDIIKYTNCDPQKVIVVPVAVDEIYKPFPKEFNQELPVLLHIGTAPNKNLDRLISAINGLPCRLIIVGRLAASDIQSLEENKIDYDNRVNISQEEMYHAYCESDVVTFVSTFEGFGMPIVEANCVERPVITGMTSSMPEVGGDAACYVDAFSVRAIRNGIIKIFNDEQYRNSLLQNGRLNKERFSNAHIAQLYADVYNQVLSSN